MQYQNESSSVCIGRTLTLIRKKDRRNIRKRRRRIQREGNSEFTYSTPSSYFLFPLYTHAPYTKSLSLELVILNLLPRLNSWFCGSSMEWRVWLPCCPIVLISAESLTAVTFIPFGLITEKDSHTQLTWSWDEKLERLNKHSFNLA